MKGARYRILWKGQITGPFDREQVEAMLSKNEIGVWAEISEGNSDWKPISESRRIVINNKEWMDPRMGLGLRVATLPATGFFTGR